MPRVRPALAVVLLVLAAMTVPLTGGVSAPADPADTPVVGTSERSSQVLLLTAADEATFDEPNASVTSALRAGHEDFAIDLQLGQLEQRLDAADNRSTRRALLRDATDDAAERVRALRTRAESARQAYVDGDITAAEYVRTLGEVHAEATSLSSSLGSTSASGTLYSYAYDNGFPEIGTQVYRLRAQLATVEGPVRERVAAVLHGDRNQIRVHVTAGNGVMLSAIDDGQYVRETVRPDNVEGTLGGDISDAPAIIQRQYPWLSNHSTSPSIETRGGYAFYYTANYGHGQISSYIDTTTERVYAERHQQTLAQLPADVEQQATANNATLTTSRTYTGGPLLVRAEDETGEPLDTTVSLNGTTVGSTGDDGRLWVVSPAGEYRVATTHEGVTMAVNVTARPAP